MRPYSRCKVARHILLFWCLFIGLGAVAGAICMLSSPDGSALGMQSLLPYFQVLPFANVLFQDYVFSGWALLIVNGLTNLIAALLLYYYKRAGVILGGAFGVTLMLWICIQFVIFPSNFLSTIYFFFGLAQALTGFAAYVFDSQERMVIDERDYPNVGSNHKRLVVYFSRMGYVRGLAYRIAQETGADMYEIRATERTRGTLGFWWCGRFGMHRWPMSIEPVNVALEKYEHVTLCAPIWVFALSSPMRAFCKQAAGRIENVDYVFSHFQKHEYPKAVQEMDALLHVKHGHVMDVCCRHGKVVYRHELIEQAEANTTAA